MGAKYTKGQADATAKYMQDKHTIKVITPKEKAEEYKKEAVAADKSLNKFIVDCVDERIKSEKGKNVYTHEIAGLLGEVYNGILEVLNKRGNDPYWAISDRYPMKCFTMLYPRATMLGIPEKLDRGIARLMDMIDVDDMGKMINAPMPSECIIDSNKGMMKSDGN